MRRACAYSLVGNTSVRRLLIISESLSMASSPGMGTPRSLRSVRIWSVVSVDTRPSSASSFFLSSRCSCMFFDDCMRSICWRFSSACGLRMVAPASPMKLLNSRSVTLSERSGSRKHQSALRARSGTSCLRSFSLVRASFVICSKVIRFDASLSISRMSVRHDWLRASEGMHTSRRWLNFIESWRASG